MKKEKKNGVFGPKIPAFKRKGGVDAHIYSMAHCKNYAHCDLRKS